MSNVKKRSFWAELAEALVIRPSKDAGTPKSRSDSFAGDLSNALALRPVYHGPQQSEQAHGTNKD